MPGIIIKIKIHSSCEIEDFVDTHILQAVCDTPIGAYYGGEGCPR